MKTIEEIKKSGRVAIDEQSADGFSGVIQFPHWAGTLVCSWGAGWEHVSVAPFRRNYTPTWDDMCLLKNIFWHEEEAAIQIHPPKSEYVNNLSNCLHLWRCIYREMVLPPACLVGIKDGQTKGDLLDEIDAAYKLAETYKDPLEAFAEMLEDYEDTDCLKVKYLKQFLNYYRGGAKNENLEQ